MGGWQSGYCNAVLTRRGNTRVGSSPTPSATGSVPDGREQTGKNTQDAIWATPKEIDLTRRRIA